MGLVKTRRLAAMQKQQRAKAGIRMKSLHKKPLHFPIARGQEEAQDRTALNANILKPRLKEAQQRISSPKPL